MTPAPTPEPSGMLPTDAYSVSYRALLDHPDAIHASSTIHASDFYGRTETWARLRQVRTTFPPRVKTTRTDRKDRTTMQQRFVTIVGIMSWDETATTPPTPPGGIWGPTDPRPSNPIANVPGISNPNPPGWGMRPEHPIYYPPGIWGPPGPWPSPPIAGIPGLPGYEPPRPPLGIWGPFPGFPTPPIANVPGAPGYQPPSVLPPGGTPLPPAVNVPIEGKLVFVPGYGWTFIPNGAASPQPPTPPSDAHPDHTLPGDLPHIDHTLPGDLPGSGKK